MPTKKSIFPQLSKEYDLIIHNADWKCKWFPKNISQICNYFLSFVTFRIKVKMVHQNPFLIKKSWFLQILERIIPFSLIPHENLSFQERVLTPFLYYLSLKCNYWVSAGLPPLCSGWPWNAFSVAPSHSFIPKRKNGVYHRPIPFLRLSVVNAAVREIGICRTVWAVVCGTDAVHAKGSLV